MRYWDTIGLFSEPQTSSRVPSAFFVSAVVHSVGLGMLSYGILNHPVIRDRIITERYSVRHLELHAPPPQNSNEGEGIAYGGPEATPPRNLSDVRNGTQPAVLPQTPRGAGGHQTLVQPEFHSHLALSEETPVPTIVIWTPELAASQRIVPPAPDKATVADTTPSLDAPNEELDLADNSVATNDLAPQALAMPSGSTSPLVVKPEELAQLAPASTSDSNEQPTPTAILSLSDIRMPDGEVILPPVNETKSAVSSTSQGQEIPAAVSEVVKPIPSMTAGSTNGNRASNSSEKPNGTAVLAHQDDTGKGAAILESDAMTTATGQDNTYHLTLPANGQFSVVVVGTSLADEYPETLQFWNDRVAYTAYLHVGLSKNWILQYSLVRSADAVASGSVAKLEAPWPYDIMRPNLVSSDLNADALMIHGILNQAGRFESLAIAFPLQYIRAAFVLHALQQWQFRPARQNGKAISIEVLLIIPDELE